MDLNKLKAEVAALSHPYQLVKSGAVWQVKSDDNAKVIIESPCYEDCWRFVRDAEEERCRAISRLLS